MVAGFFYGLYMDPEMLKALGYRPEGAVQACLKEYRLDLQGAAKVIPQKNSEVWGNILHLPEEDLAKMYGSETTKAYQPELLEVFGKDGEACPLTVYNLPPSPEAPFNFEYLNKLLPLAERLNLPPDYQAFLKELGQRFC